jgi:hypothetical protein
VSDIGYEYMRWMDVLKSGGGGAGEGERVRVGVEDKNDGMVVCVYGLLAWLVGVSICVCVFL